MIRRLDQQSLDRGGLQDHPGVLLPIGEDPAPGIARPPDLEAQAVGVDGQDLRPSRVEPLEQVDQHQLAGQGHSKERGWIIQHGVGVAALAKHRVEHDLEAMGLDLEPLGFGGIGLGRGLCLNIKALGQDFREQVRTAVPQAARSNPERCHHGWIIGCDIGLEDRMLRCGSVQECTIR